MQTTVTDHKDSHSLNPARSLLPLCPDFSLAIERDSVTGVQTGPIGLRILREKTCLTGATRHGPVLDSSASSVPHEARPEPPRVSSHDDSHPPGARTLGPGDSAFPQDATVLGWILWIIKVGALLLDDK